MQRIHENESVRHLIFSPEFGAAKFRALASLLCVTDQRWLIVLRESDGSTIVDESSFDSTLLVELTIILLYGQLIIAEEKSSRWFHFRHHAKYGAIITYFPLNRLANFRIDPHSRFSILELQGHEGHGGEKLEIMFPPDKREAVSRLMEKASSPASFAGVDHLVKPE